MNLIYSLGDQLLFFSCIIILIASLVLTIKTRFVQFRMIPRMLKLFFGKKKGEESSATVRAHRALFTAMSTTIGISTIVSPFIAIRLGGPGAVLGFFIATLLGTAVNFAEVTLALSYRKQRDGKVLGGPMQYLKDAIHPFLAKWYAFFGFVLLMAWSSAQSNQLAQILSSPLLGQFHIPVWVTGIFLAVFITLILIGGIKRVADISTKLVPLMFLLYVGSSLWIIFLNLEKLPEVLNLIIVSAISPQTFATGATVGGIVSALRWGVFKGLQSNEAGVGTQTIPHSMAETEIASQQGILSMISTYSAGFICILSSLVALMTETWMDVELSIGINMVAASFERYFSSIGVLIIGLSAFLFAFGTILGNSFNGSQCFSYLSNQRFLKFYYLATAALIFWGSISEVTVVWSVIDFFLIPVVIPHILAVVFLAFKRSDLLQHSEQAMAVSKKISLGD
jgi:AGCS family alanine or glycine:cation symporter